MLRTTTTALTVAATTLLLVGCETTNMKMGSQDAKTVATGSAAGSATSGESSALEKCASPLGTISLVENQNAGWYSILRNEYKLPPTSNLLRLLVQQSNCFVVVERGAAGMRAMSRERDLMQSGEMRGGSNFGKGQMVASDYGMSPEIIFSDNNTGATIASLGGLIGGGAARALTRIGGSMRTREASAMLTLVDNRSGVQVSASEGSASKTDLDILASLSGSRIGGSLGSYQSTPQGKVIAAAFMDAYNQMVRSLRNYRTQRVQGQGLGGGGRLGVDGAAAPSRTNVPGQGGTVMSLSEAQQHLNNMGYNVGTPDGAMGPRTAAGLRDFQRASGLRATGRLDNATMDALANH
ncbi:peptidoglycan-binding protein [Ottowia sp.]|uniref:peptidoglycan-binding protein n=1 Tax=Ottowia sp. TaxID=1898956 RepID=UPI003A8384AB